jgi:FkbM family methyltransferase
VKIVFDVGANVGDKADVFRHLAGRVLCLEADPDTSAILRHRFRKRSEVTVESCAVGDRDGQAQLNRKPYCGFNTLSEKWASAMDRQNVMTTDVVSVPMTTLDQLILRYGRPDYIKIDVEGYELPVVRGLTSSVPILSFECNLPTFRTESNQVLDHLLTLDPAVRFNVRNGDSAEWMLREPAEADAIRKILGTPDMVTYEVFAFSPRRS